MSFARDERIALCDLLAEVGPDAPTLCAGWTTHDLAAHLWIRETDPVGAPGILAKPLAGLTERRMAETKARWSYQELVERVRNGPARFSVFALPGVDEPANNTEFFVHHEDVRRAGEHPQGPRELDREVEEWMWRRLKLMGRAFFRRARVGVVLERMPVTAAEPGSEPETIRAQTGTPIVTAVGEPSELMIFANGRTSVAEVKLVGEQDAIDALLGSDLTT
ncbi:MAG: TIGR03085 family protein [Microlunatus sp.]|nr:TIGR03085 family protein [Microlunatus sp.]